MRNRPIIMVPAAQMISMRQLSFAESAFRAVEKHPFRVLKRQFGYTKVRYRGLAKNTGQIVTLFALMNSWLARKRQLPVMG